MDLTCLRVWYKAIGGTFHTAPVALFFLCQVVQDDHSY